MSDLSFLRRPACLMGLGGLLCTLEPAQWYLVGMDAEQDLQSGSLLLVVHHSDVTFGDVEVRPIV